MDLLDDKAWSSIKGAIIASLGVVITAVASRVMPDVISPDMSNIIAAAVVTTLINAVKQYAFPSKK